MGGWVGWVAVFALIIAIFAMIVIIIAIYIFQRDNDLARALTDEWVVVQGTAGASSGSGTSENFNATPNSIYIVNSAVASGFNINITAYTNINLGVSATTTTLFIIDNTTGGGDVIVVPPDGATSVTGAKPGGVANPATVAKGTSGTFMWLTATTIKRLN